MLLFQRFKDACLIKKLHQVFSQNKTFDFESSKQRKETKSSTMLEISHNFVENQVVHPCSHWDHEARSTVHINFMNYFWKKIEINTIPKVIEQKRAHDKKI